MPQLVWPNCHIVFRAAKRPPSGKFAIRSTLAHHLPTLSLRWTEPGRRELFARLLLACNATVFLTFRSAGLSDEIRQASPVALSRNNSSTSSTKYRWALFLAWLSGLLPCLACSGAGRMMPLKCSKVAVQARSRPGREAVTLGKNRPGKGLFTPIIRTPALGLGMALGGL